MSNYFDDLSQFDQGYEKASTQNNVVDGRYLTVVKECQLRKAKSSGNLMLSWTLIVTDGAYAGRFIFKNSMITQNSLEFLKKDISTAGVEIKKLSQLEGALGQFENRILQVSVITKEGSAMPNVYIDKYMGMGNWHSFVKRTLAEGFREISKDQIASDEDDFPFN